MCVFVKYDNNKRSWRKRMETKTRAISWIKSARNDFAAFPDPVQIDALRALHLDGHTTSSIPP